MSTTITLTAIPFVNTPAVNQTVHVSWRLATDPDVPGSYTPAADATVQPNGTISSPSPYEIVVPDHTVVIKAVNGCGGTGLQKTFIICTPVTSISGAITPVCGSGFTLSPDMTYCYQVLTAAADYVGGGSPTTACHTTNSNYGRYGIVFYKTTGLDPSDGTWDFSNPANNPNSYTTVSPVTTPNINVTSYTTGFWINDTPFTTTKGRLNITGLWDCSDPSAGGTLGFSRQINIPSSKYYLIGTGADDFSSISVNGSTIVTQNVATLSGTDYFNGTNDELFRYWHVYPVFLNAGPNIIQMSTTNSGSAGSLGFEVYDATEAQLMAVTSESDLNPYIIFTTRDITDGSDFNIGNYDCHTHPGYELVYDAGMATYLCKKIVTNSPF